ncbi:MAG: ABC transporter ATP-binding protein [Candidatus Omnitrophota bacterium]|nr:ABC transporter ATP-binding protein [Candidatus Omnitrophota bacterium]
MNNVVVFAQNLHKSYHNGTRRLDVLKGINLTIEKGGLQVIVGPSGAGKSTLLHILGGLDRPASGSVFLNNTEIYKVSDSQRARLRNEQIGFIFQFYHLLSEFTALENVMLPGLIKLSGPKGKKSKVREKAADLLKLIGLEHRVTHKPCQLSGGEQQRVAIARALINDPDVVFCDEPTGNLDSENGGMIYDLIRRLNRDKGQTFIVVTHQGEIARNAGKVYKMKDGQLWEDLWV